MDKGLVELGCVVDVTFDVRTVEELTDVEATVLADVTLTDVWAPLVDEGIVMPVLIVAVAITDALLVDCIVLLVAGVVLLVVDDVLDCPASAQRACCKQ